MRKYITMAGEWVEEKLRRLCGRIIPERRNMVVIVALGIFAIMSLYIFGNAIYQIGKHEGAKMSIEHIKILEIEDNGKQ